MADNSAIEWTESTWNPIAGCTAVSAGCDHCYAARQASGRLSRLPLYAGLAVDGTFTGEVRLAPERLDQPLRWKRPRRVFVNSMSDLFHEAVPDLFISHVFEVMEQAKRHTFQVLTKRHARMRSFVQRREQTKREYAAKFDDCPTEAMRNSPAAQWARRRAANPPSNVWLGVSVETQQWADIRVPALLDTPAAVRFLSCEPLLGPIDLHWCAGVDSIERDWVGGPTGGSGAPHPLLDWVILGGESGPGARPMDIEWARGIVEQCQDAGVPVFVKQLGSRHGRQHHEIELFPEALRVREYPR